MNRRLLLPKSLEPRPLPARLLLWTIICSVSAAPSFLAAFREYDVTGMVSGVVIFILAYTAVTGTAIMAWVNTKPAMRLAVQLGYWIRLILSVIFPVGLHLDIGPGVISVRLGEAFFSRPTEFAGTLFTTLMQGVLLNIILFIIVALLLLLTSVGYAICGVDGWHVLLEGYCRDCGYNLTGNVSGRCPECGRSIDWQD